MTAFKDHFSGHADVYRSFRPSYPDALFRAIAARAPATNRIWDCGCGNGQASVGLIAHFAEVLATDASAEQIAAAAPHPRVRYSAAPAERCGLAALSCDAILVAQALHWFDFERFYAEARRVARPGALIVAVCYELANISPRIDAATLTFYKADIGPYWPPDRGHIETRYRDIPWPFPKVAMPEIEMATNWRLDSWLGYISSWSAVQRYRAATGRDPIPAFREELLPLWGDPDAPKAVTWPLTILAGRVE